MDRVHFRRHAARDLAGRGPVLDGVPAGEAALDFVFQVVWIEVFVVRVGAAVDLVVDVRERAHVRGRGVPDHRPIPWDRLGVRELR